VGSVSKGGLRDSDPAATVLGSAVQSTGEYRTTKIITGGPSYNAIGIATGRRLLRRVGERRPRTTRT